MGKLVVIKNGILQTAPFPGDHHAQAQAEEYLNETTQYSTNPFITSTLAEPPASDDSTDTFVTRSRAEPSEPVYINKSGPTYGGPSVQNLATIFEQNRLQEWINRNYLSQNMREGQPIYSG